MPLPTSTHLLWSAQIHKKGLVDKLVLNCPLRIQEYNQHMGTMDSFDHRLAYYSMKLRSCKWWCASFYFLIDIAAISGLDLWRMANPEDADLLDKCTWIGGLIKETERDCLSFNQ